MEDAAKMDGSFYRPRKYLTPPNLLIIYDSYIRPKIEYCRRICIRAANSHFSLSKHHIVQKGLRGLVSDELHSVSLRRNVAGLWLPCSYSQDKCTAEIHSLLQRIGNAISRSRSQLILISFPFSLKEGVSIRLLRRTTPLWNRLASRYFLAYYGLNLFQSRVKCYSYYIFS